MLDTVARSEYVQVPNYQYPKSQVWMLKQFFSQYQPKPLAVGGAFKAAQHKSKKKP